MVIETTLYNLYVTGCNVVNLMENDELILSKHKFNKNFRAELIKLTTENIFIKIFYGILSAIKPQTLCFHYFFLINSRSTPKNLVFLMLHLGNKSS
jgi:hypothetical protein